MHNGPSLRLVTSGGALQGDLLMLQIRPPVLRACRADGSGVRTVIADLGNTPDGIQIDVAGGFIYWTNMGADFAAADGTIERARFDGSERTVLVGNGAVTTPKQLALDAGGRKLYWCDREGMRVMRSGLDGSGIETLVRRGDDPADAHDELRHCVGIALDPDNRYIYWTQKGPDNGDAGRIFRMSMDVPAGSTPDDRVDIELLADGLPEPIDLHVDRSTARLYWTDRGAGENGNTLNRARIVADGLAEIEVIAHGFEEAIGLALDEERQVAFVSDLGGHIRRISLRDDLSGHSSEELLVQGPTTGLALMTSV